MSLGIGGLPQQETVGGLGGLGGADWGSLLQAVGASLMSSSRQAPLANVATLLPQFTQAAEKRRTQEQNRVAMTAALKQAGVSDEMAASMAASPQAAEVWLQHQRQQQAQTNADRSYGLQERQFAWQKENGAADNTRANEALEIQRRNGLTDAARYAMDQGHQPGTPEYNDAIKTFYSSKFRKDAPSGYTYGQDGKLAPIPGGPQDPERDINDPLPGEIGARFGLANEYFTRFDRIETDLKSKDPRLVGPIDNLGFGQSGALQRDVKLGSEAMVRMLTGAGMSQQEAENEVRQYLPAQGDNAATVLDKQYRLRSALRNMQREALKGRRSNRQIEKEYPAFESPDFSEIEKRVGGRQGGPIGTNRASAGAARSGGLQVGQTATNRQTGAKVMWDGQQWVPAR